MPEQNQGLKVGASIVSSLSDAFYEDAARAFEEYVINASDALATNVKIKVNPNIVEIEDDGEGMTSEELRRFFYISHSSKVAGEIREMPFGKGKRTIKRQIIGRFGIGKLSAYKFADTISIKTLKDGVMSSAVLSFGELMSKEFVEDLVLDVKSTKADSTQHGTIVQMTGLKQQVYAKTIMKRLAERLTLHPDLHIEVNGAALAPEILKGKKIPIDEEHPVLGRITGTLIYTDDVHTDEAGVRIRVYGRIVNLNPKMVSALVNVTGMLSLHAHTFLDINVDSLAPAVLAHRNGFQENNKLVEELEGWIKKKMNAENAAYLKGRTDETDKLQEAKVIVTLAHRFSGGKGTLVTSPKASSMFYSRKRITDRAAALKEADELIAKKDSLALSFKNKRFVFDVAALGEDENVWVFESKSRKVNINSEHPLFKEAKGRRSQDLYSLAVGIVAIAFETSKNHTEFKENYEELARAATKK